MQIKTLQVRVKDKHAKLLKRMAFESNQIWNAANAFTADYSYVPIPGVGYVRSYFSAFDLQKKLKNIRYEREFCIPAITAQEVIAVHAKSRKQFKTDKLKWRSSSGSKRSLGWVPFKAGALKYKKGMLRFAGHLFDVWDSYDLSQYEFRSGSFSEDARGRWYLNIVVKVAIEESKGKGKIGVDLGLKTTATCSDGTEFSRQDCYRKLEPKLAISQRANNKKRVRSIHAKIKNQRKDAIHKFTRKLVDENNLIVVGDVSSASLAKTKMAKSVLDAGWFMLKAQLKYKAIGQSVEYVETSEAYTTQTCSHCGCIGPNSPKGRAGLGIRLWVCSECGAQHDRDINAAKNILIGVGHDPLAVERPAT